MNQRDIMCWFNSSGASSLHYTVDKYGGPALSSRLDMKFAGINHIQSYKAMGLLTHRNIETVGTYWSHRLPSRANISKESACPVNPSSKDLQQCR